MKIKLSVLMDEVHMVPESACSVLDRETGERYFISEDDRFALGHKEMEPPKWQKVHLRRIKPILDNMDSQRYIPLPSSRDFPEDSVKEQFIASISDPRIQHTLRDAVKSDDASDGFKECLQSMELADLWSKYHDNALKDFLIQWCKNEGIPYTDDTEGKPPAKRKKKVRRETKK
ncbi:MAG: hypothetical protein GY765_35510 [bacterium]|nr:hypothetical protein [bacterium]